MDHSCPRLEQQQQQQQQISISTLDASYSN